MFRMKIAMITAGGAGMFCGSCMQDNTLVRALRAAGADAVLIPTYTPIRVDEENVSSKRVFLGGINVYLDSAIPGWRWLPSFITHLLDRPAVIRLLTRLSSSTDAAQLGRLTIDLLSGIDGPQHREIRELVDYLCDDLKPDVVLFSNALLSGVVPALRRRYTGTILTLLQGDDIFLEGLTPQYKSQAMDLLTKNCQSLNGILTHSRYYSGFMQTYLNLPAIQFLEVPLMFEPLQPARSWSGPADVPANRLEEGSANAPEDDSHATKASDQAASDMLTIGYFARICPEKGVHRFLDAAAVLAPRNRRTRFMIAGYLPAQHRNWFHRRLKQAQNAASVEQILWNGSPDSRQQKFDVLRQFDLLCVPTDYQEPKGLYVLEAASLGVPSLLPNHGAFPERIEALGEGLLFEAGSMNHLIQTLDGFISQRMDPEVNQSVEQVSKRLMHGVETNHSLHAAALSFMQAVHRLEGQYLETM